MNLPTAFDSSSARAPIASGDSHLELAGLAISALVALVFMAYLLRCYFQEFWRAYRVRRRKRLARLKSFLPVTDREAVIEGCRRRRASAMASEAAAGPGFDWRALHSFIPSHDRLTLVWDTGSANDGALPRFCVGKETDETITAKDEVHVR
jgi:hypothetical protein